MRRAKNAIVRQMMSKSGFYMVPLFGKHLVVDRAFARRLATDDFEPETTRYFKKSVLTGQVIIDVGAHFGYYTLLFSQLVGKHGRVYAFEPDPATHKILTFNKTLNGLDNVTIFKIALGDHIGRERFFVNAAGTSGLLPTRGTKEIIEVAVVTLDNYLSRIEHVDLIKIDTEGTEAAVFRGARKTIEKCWPKVLVEFIPRNAPVDELLKELDGWSTYGLDSNLLCHKKVEK